MMKSAILVQAAVVVLCFVATIYIVRSSIHNHDRFELVFAGMMLTIGAAGLLHLGFMCGWWK